MQDGVVLVTGASGGSQGQTGRHVSELLLARGIPVRAFVRRIDDRSERLRSLGAEVFVGDLLDYHSVERATQGASAVYFAYPVQEGLLEASTIMADAARKAGVARLIDMVMLVSSPDAPTARMRENYLSERIFEWAGIGASHVRATIFYENLRALTTGTISRDDSIMLPWGDESTVIPLVSGEDVARVAVGVLTDPSVAPGSSFQVIGEILHLSDIVRTFERVLDRKVRYQEITDKAWIDTALARGMNRHAVEHLSKLWQALRKGLPRFDVPDTILKFAGKSAKTFEEFLKEHKTAFAPPRSASPGLEGIADKTRERVTEKMSGTGISHQAVRLDIAVGENYEEFRRRFEAAVPVWDRGAELINRKAAWREVIADVIASAPHDFLLYWKLDMAPLMNLAGNTRRATEYLMGNHVIAETMYRHDPAAALYVPLRCAIYESDAEARFTIERPSANLSSLGRAEITEIGLDLDRKLAKLLAALNLEVPAVLTGSRAAA